jgi:tetratricopeptide (TPR) repeat protein
MESDNENASTSPRRVKPVYTPEPPPEPTPQPPRRRVWLKVGFKSLGIVLGCLILLLAFAAAGGYLGYLSGMQARLEAEVGVVAYKLADQYQMGIDDLNAGRLEFAKKRFEWILEKDPGFPGLTDQLARMTAEAESRGLTITPTPSPTPTLAITPTPDLRGEAELFAAAQQHLQNREWQEAIQTLISLRNLKLDYQALEADGIFYIALRYRGMQRINNGDLEGGMYDLTLVEKFGPLDGDAVGLRSFARIYLTGAGFWEVDWEKVVFYFGQIYKIVPNLRDSTNTIAAERYRLALVRWGDALIVANDPCKAQTKYEDALKLNNLAAVADKRNLAAEQCVASYTPTPGPATETPTLTPGGETPIPPTETPTPTNNP